MAVALVGSLGALQSGASPRQGAFGQATTAGNLLIGWISQDLAQLTTVDQSWVFTETAAATNWKMAYKANCGASETAPTFTSAGAVIDVVLAEFSGVVTTSPLENHNVTGAPATNTVTATCAAADAASGNLLMLQGEFELTKSGTDTTTITSNNCTVTNVANNDSASSAVHYRFGYGVATSNAAAANCTATDTSMNIQVLQGVIASFKASAAAAAFQPRPTGVDFADPAVFMGAPAAIRRAWHRRSSGIFVPEYAI